MWPFAFGAAGPPDAYAGGFPWQSAQPAWTPDVQGAEAAKTGLA
jgi:hypothetical protein